MAKVKKTRRASDRRITSKEVADLAGVSFSAVSRTFTKGASVSAKTREKVLKAARKLGYQPNVHARSLMTRRTELIGLICSNFDNPVFMEVFDLFTRRLQMQGLRPLIANLSSGQADDTLDTLLQYSVDGVIVATSNLPADFAQRCRRANLPVVYAFGRPKAPGAANIISSDFLQAGRLAGDLLQERGYRKIAFIGGPTTTVSTGDRLAGLTASLEANGLEPHTTVYGNAYTHEAGLSLMRQLIRTGGMDAVFCGDDVVALGALDACREAGIRVPGDIGIIGFNDIAMAGWSAYQLTTIREPIADIIGTAIDRVIELINQPQKKPKTVLFDCSAVIRNTLRPLV
ncbi:MAG TPA: LacI family DNA-binding transcriptional regulator [Bauldia sp.]|nr:LacI family DNA-binding transcriptional regulator [Bauldia sp.]